jgi:hypothetical protein
MSDQATQVGRPVKFWTNEPAPAPARAKDVNGVIRHIAPGDLVYQGDIVNMLLQDPITYTNYLMGKRNGEWAIGMGEKSVTLYLNILPCVANETGNNSENYAPAFSIANNQSW